MECFETIKVEISIPELKAHLAIIIQQCSGKKVVVDNFETKWTDNKLVCFCSPRHQDIHLPATSPENKS